jgi:hypothetical protein
MDVMHAAAALLCCADGARAPQHIVLGGLFCLVLFQLPTTIMFESGAYEISSSVSIIGGLLLATSTSL